MRFSGSQNGPFVPLISITYALKVHCHGRGRGFEPRRHRHHSKALRMMGDPKKDKGLRFDMVQ